MYNVKPVKMDRLKLLVIMNIVYTKKNPKTLYADGHSNSKVSQTANVNPTKWKGKGGYCEKAQGQIAHLSLAKQLISVIK